MKKETTSYDDFMKLFKAIMEEVHRLPLKDENKGALKACYARFKDLDLRMASKECAKKLKF